MYISYRAKGPHITTHAQKVLLWLAKRWSPQVKAIRLKNSKDVESTSKATRLRGLPSSRFEHTGSCETCHPWSCIYFERTRIYFGMTWQHPTCGWAGSLGSLRVWATRSRRLRYRCSREKLGNMAVSTHSRGMYACCLHTSARHARIAEFPDHSEDRKSVV